MNALLWVLGDSPSASEPVSISSFPVSISSFDDTSLTITNAPALPLRAPVKVTEGDRLWLGEVVEYHPNGVAVIHVLHLLNNLTELSRLSARFTGHVPAKAEPEPTLS